MKHLKTTSLCSAKNGFSTILMVFVILLFFMIALVGFDFGYIAYSEKQNTFPTPTGMPNQQLTPVVARGMFSKSKYSASITLNFNLEGGAVSGKFSGDCTGTISGVYDGQEGGVISGKAVGSCNPFFVPVPASATFSGTVNQQSKRVSIFGTGSAMGFSGDGSLVLTF